MRVLAPIPTGEPSSSVDEETTVRVVAEVRGVNVPPKLANISVPISTSALYQNLFQVVAHCRLPSATS